MPETPCSRTLSIDLAIKKTGEGGSGGEKDGDYRLRVRVLERKKDKHGFGATKAAQASTEDKYKTE